MNHQARSANQSSSASETTFLRRCLKSFCDRRVRGIARNPWSHFCIALSIAVALSVTGIIIGDFKIEINNKGWFTRGTRISDRHSQVLLMSNNQVRLQEADNEEFWQELEENVQPGWYNDEYSSRRRLTNSRYKWTTNNITQERKMMNGCDLDYYSRGPPFQKRRLIAIWKTQKDSPFNSSVINDICNAEQNTQAVLDENDLCVRCDDGSCLPPLSVVSYARFAVQDFNFQLSCEDLALSWDTYKNEQGDIEDQIVDCVKDLKNQEKSAELPSSCPIGFSPSMVSQNFDSFIVKGDGGNEYTSTVFATLRQPNDLYQQNAKYDRGNGTVKGLYDTNAKDFQYANARESIGNDLALAIGSATITALAILVHTRSPLITLVGLIQICLTFPVAYFFYTLVGQIVFFPFLNFVGIFVAFALGADDIFVAVDKWKNARHANRSASVEEVALVAIPDAASAMFLTSITTAGAFFATAICPIAPLKCFAIFCGLLISFDYILCLTLILPILCVYDKWTANTTSTLELEGNKSCWNTLTSFCCYLRCCIAEKKDNHLGHLNDDNHDKSDGKQEIFIRRILGGFYPILHKLRWLILAVSIGSATFAVMYTTKNLQMPESSAVPILRPFNEFAMHEAWRQNLLYTLWQQEASSEGYIIWGLKAADTGDHTNPDSFTNLVLDDLFEPSSIAAQKFLLDFCDKLFANDGFAEPILDNYVCPMNQFDKWLRTQSLNSTSLAFNEHCDNAQGIPMAVKNFHSCFSSWAAEESVSSVISRNGVLTIMYIPYTQNIFLYSSYAALNTQWHLTEKWLTTENENAPPGINKFYFSSFEYWWYDTNGKLLETAFVAAGITLCISGIVVLVYFRSLALTLYSVASIAYVLITTTALLIAWGWTLGFIESICLAILIGISCDFVIHLGHAYASPIGSVSSSERTKHALLVMGPSILASSFTTIAASVIMLFTIIQFFVQFAQILMFTMILATLASIVIFLTLTDCFGPTSFQGRTVQLDGTPSVLIAPSSSAEVVIDGTVIDEEVSV
eukprot:CAMPEP_0178935532 /NCGR_PEP_ID=MMETSP0786-20121207/24609_1 /TAXON_ID=186022 /ORGANISM="Thalassionema frauenfeldii, Strain CCMP 1798" /LENGTH=1026 /DNA_ID=CAMNT_0020613713 /DNA_START=1680 /DNA_END=4760 /DNA_ORIENTATION=-